MIAERSNFAFFQTVEPQLCRLGSLAERYFTEDPNTCLLKLRQLAETIAKLTAGRFGLVLAQSDSFATIISLLRNEVSLPREVSDLFHSLRSVGNEAAHAGKDTHRDALQALKFARQLSGWYMRVFHDNSFTLTAYIPPSAPSAATDALKAELEAMRTALQAALSESEQAQITAQTLARQNQSAEDEAAQARQEREVWAQLAADAERDKNELTQRLQRLIEAGSAEPTVTRQAKIEQAKLAASKITLDEAETRAIIDQQLSDAGWEADSKALRYASGARPVKGRFMAIAEWPTDSGPADYALFHGLTLLGTVEAKRKNKNVMEVLAQAQRYAKDIKLIDCHPPEGGPWGEFKAPFIFSTNGRPYLRQIKALSGIWRRDLRDPNNPAEVLTGWPTPQGLMLRLGVDRKAAHEALGKQALDFGFPLRPYQQKAIQKVEAALSEDARSILVAMATGTGKTKLAIAMLYRLIAAKRFRRVCFVVDRSALGEQTEREFATTKVINGKTFSDIFGMKGLEDVHPDEDTRIHICTIQGLVKRVLYSNDPAEAPAVDQYDLLVVDECHRGYLLDREMSEGDMTFRSQDDYISKYRRVLEHFDAVKIGLTATPALHTTDIFGPPIYTYSYREAVVDGFLIDHEPPIRIGTLLSEAGIRFEKDEEVDLVHVASGDIEKATLPDSLDFEVEQFNKSVITVPFNRAIAQELTNHIDITGPEKTLVFAVSKAHADILVEELRKAFRDAQGPFPDETIRRITGEVDKVGQLILSYRNDPLPKIAVTVDLLTTGVDVPRITNLVFMRRVNSRILYEQMLGRATRLCPEIEKNTFRIFDAVDLYTHLQHLTDMKPVASDPKFTLEMLFAEMVGPADEEHKARVREQIIVRMRRRIKKMPDEARARYEKAAGETPEASLARFMKGDAAGLATWLANKPNLGAILDWTNDDGTPRYIPISEHPDEVTGVTHGYGAGSKPEDFLDAFTKFVRENVNTMTALQIVVQRPAELTRQELRQLRLELDAAGFSDVNVKRAWADATNEEIAASIIGFIRQAALGDALIPYATRINQAVQRILKSRQWTTVQRQWIERIGQQLEKQQVLDRDAFEQEPFAARGGWSAINKAFNGELDKVVRDITEQIWKDAG